MGLFKKIETTITTSKIKHENSVLSHRNLRFNYRKKLTKNVSRLSKKFNKKTKLKYGILFMYVHLENSEINLA